MEIWNYCINKLPKDGEEVIVCVEGMPDAMCGIYNGGNWIVEIDGDKEENANVIAWQKKPKAVASNCRFEFRTAAEARYLQKVAQKYIDEDEEYGNFVKVRLSILSAATCGESETVCPLSFVTPVIVAALEAKGFEVVTNTDLNIAEIKWGY